MPPSGTDQHPIELSSDIASYAGSPYQGPDEWDQYFNQFSFYHTPEHPPPTYPPPQTPPLPKEDEPKSPDQFKEQQQPQQRKIHTGVRMSLRAREWSSSLPPLPPSYPSILEDPQMGGRCHTTPAVDPAPVGYDNPIPTYPNPTGFDIPYAAAAADYAYPAPSYDPYLQAVIQNALHPPPFPPTYQNPGYPNAGYEFRLCLNHNHLNHQLFSK
ncbi:extensin-like [Helianthus annuus]|uniref:extensin-like n=1 Tax=Helianthus annuus TaxID=4232 RepID=UPI000B8F12B1|nr:extensin-like [Helianthus annuus]